jgi:parvulin-like peptidyl-prolyl isomerase
MKKLIFTIFTAGIFIIPALLFASDNETQIFDNLTTYTIKRIASSIWFEARHYDEIKGQELYEKVSEDLKFDSWLADKAESEGFQLSEKEESFLKKETENIMFASIISFLEKEMEVTDLEVEEMSPAWLKLIPERWEVLYIFIDTSMTEDEAEKKKLAERARSIKKQLTPRNFANFACLWSDAPNSVDGGYMGSINLDNFGPTFKSNIRQTPPGNIGGPYATKSGWNIFYVRSHTPERKRKISRKKLREMVANVKADIKAGELRNSKESMNFFIHKHGIMQSPEYQLEIQALRNYSIGRLYILKKIDKNKASEKDLLEIYKEKSSSMKHPPKRKVREILVTSDYWNLRQDRKGWFERRSVRDRARALREEIMKNNVDFAEMAKKYSASKTAVKGGDLGWIQEPSSYQIDRPLSMIKKGEITVPIASKKGYILLKLEDVKDKKPMTFEEARQKCEDVWKYRLKKNLEKNLRATFKNYLEAISLKNFQQTVNPPS